MFAEIEKQDLPELYNTLKRLFVGRRNCRLWVCIGRHDCWFQNDKELDRFLHGFVVAMQLVDEDFLDIFGEAAAGHPKS